MNLRNCKKSVAAIRTKAGMDVQARHRRSPSKLHEVGECRRPETRFVRCRIRGSQTRARARTTLARSTADWRGTRIWRLEGTPEPSRIVCLALSTTANL